MDKLVHAIFHGAFKLVMAPLLLLLMLCIVISLAQQQRRRRLITVRPPSRVR